MQCEVCGNECDKPLEIIVNGIFHFDSFERAIHALALGCTHCGCKIIGPESRRAANFLLRQLCAS